YQEAREKIIKETQEQQAAAFEALQKEAQEWGFALIKVPGGLVLTPAVDGKPLTEAQLQQLSEERRAKVQKLREKLEQKVEQGLRRIREMEKEMREKLRQLDRETTLFAVGHLIEDLKEKYEGMDEVLAYLDSVRNDIVENVDLFKAGEEKPKAQVAGIPLPVERSPFTRYEVNVLVDRSEEKGAPVIVETNPTYHNLIGRIEHQAVMGVFSTDFTMIKPGALHRANGGYLILPVRDVLLNPFAWDGLKRSLKDRCIRIEELGTQLSLVSTVTLEPEPIPLDVKVVLIGSPLLYYLLYYYEEDFQKLFKVKADFATQMDRTPETEYQYALFVRTICQEDGLLPFDRGAVAQVIEHSSRLVEDQHKLSTRFGEIADLVREASFWASRNGHSVVTADDVRRAIKEKTFRSNLLEERIKELITQGTVMIDTTGERVGQINGLSVILLGDYTFGRPSRVTANTFVGKAGVVNIEREVELSGPIHSKGVLILSSYLGRKYAQNAPLTLSASLVFEQSYEGVEGDSASSTELYALLSSLSGYPIKQGIAVTGSVNQHGELQPVGGINEKIEGFFDICKAKGLTGDQGVIIPVGNVRNLMLREDVIEAVREGKFHIWPVRTVDEGIEILTGVPAGELQEDGTYPEGTVNWAVSQRLAEMAEEMRRATRREEEEEGTGSSSASKAEGEDEEEDEQRTGSLHRQR
ncbi:MAG: ATP-binding protein, partial [Chloroflexi bacterium]